MEDFLGVESIRIFRINNKRKHLALYEALFSNYCNTFLQFFKQIFSLEDLGLGCNSQTILWSRKNNKKNGAIIKHDKVRQ